MKSTNPPALSSLYSALKDSQTYRCGITDGGNLMLISEINLQTRLQRDSIQTFADFTDERINV